MMIGISSAFLVFLVAFSTGQEVALCCPQGQVLALETVYQEDYQQDMCAPPISEDHIGVVETQLREWQEEHNLTFRGPLGTEFTCPEELELEQLHHYQDFVATKYSLMQDGSLLGLEVDYVDHGELVVRGNYTWSTQQFCVTFADQRTLEGKFLLDGQIGQIELTFATCFSPSNKHKETHEDFLSKFSPIALAVSVFFLVMTIVIYIWSEKSNIKNITRRMTIAFLTNMVLAYSFSIVIWTTHDQMRERLPCLVLGYCLQYSALSFLFWTSVMGFDIWRTFASFSIRLKTTRGHNMKFLIYALYAQGSPLLICLATGMFDSLRPTMANGQGSKITPHYPNMAAVKCFLGEERNTTGYLGSAGFLYFDLFLVLAMVSNTFFMVSVCRILSRGWDNQTRLRRSESQPGDQLSTHERIKRGRKQAAIVIRLFIILGLPWTLNIVSSALDHQFPDLQFKWTVFTVNLTTFFAGFLIFLTLVGKASLLRDLWHQARESCTLGPHPADSLEMNKVPG